MRYSAIDPGKHIGYADYEGETPIAMGEVLCSPKDMDGLDAWLQARRNIDVLIVEGYRNRPVAMTKGHANTWSVNLESQIVGYCKAWCKATGIEFVEQDSSIKPVGYANAGLKYTPGRKGTHMQDALAHGAYFWRNTGCKRDAEQRP